MDWKARLKRYGIGGLRAAGVAVVGMVMADVTSSPVIGGLAAMAYKVVGKWARDNVSWLSWLPVL